MVLFALSRWPGLMPWNFSAAYALMFCAGVFFPKKLVWWLPFATMFVTDMLLNLYYHINYHTPMFSPDLLGNYVAYAALVWLGRRFSPKASFLSLLGSGLLGAIAFYVISNTLSWFLNPFHNPEYTKTLIGWLIALTKGTSEYSYPIKMQTWELFRNNLMSGGIFTALFAGAMKFMESREPAEDEEKEPSEEAPQAEPEAKPEEAKA